MNRMILIVDDEESIQAVLSESLELGGYESCTAADGEEGLRQFYDREPDLVITDMRMPNMDGFEFSKRVRQECDVPIIMLTGMGGAQPPDGANLSLVDAFIAKPVQISELLGHVAALLPERGISDAEVIAEETQWPS